MNDFVRAEPASKPLFRRWIGSDELINGTKRFCLYLGNADIKDISCLPLVMDRVRRVKQYRESSKSELTRKLAEIPTRFHVTNIPNADYIAIPEVSSEKRKYIPMEIFPPEVLASNLVKVLPNASLYLLGILSSSMHMTWVRAVGGRLKGDYRYSKDIIYNNFPWPKADTLQKMRIEEAVQEVIRIRSKFKNCSLALLYDPDTMPADLVHAHDKLDSVVDRIYGVKDGNEISRATLLMDMYAKSV